MNRKLIDDYGNFIRVTKEREDTLGVITKNSSYVIDKDNYLKNGLVNYYYFVENEKINRAILKKNYHG